MADSEAEGIILNYSCIRINKTKLTIEALRTLAPESWLIAGGVTTSATHGSLVVNSSLMRYEL